MIRFALTKPMTTDALNIFRNDLRQAFARLEKAGWKAGQFLVLADVRDHGVQAQDTNRNLVALAEELGSVAERNAVIISGTIHKLQVQRIAPKENIRSFYTEDEAMAWLMG